jgi:hypothetical protein
MRYVLFALALCACHRAPTGTTPANRAPAPDYRATADDELGFLPVGADMVIGINAVAMRQSALWHTFEPQIRQMAAELEKLGGSCGSQNPIDTVERATLAITMMPDKSMHGVIVVRGIDTSKMLDCTVTESKKAGGNATIDRGVVIVSYPNRPGLQMAATAVGPSTAVMQLETAVSYDTMQKVLASGSPLRGSPSFMALYQRREPGASLWGMANGNAPMFNEMAQMGMRPKSIDGTIVLTDKIAVAMRLALDSPAAAAKVGGELDKVKGPASQFVEKFDSRVEGSLVAMNVVVTEAQMRALIGMLGGAIGGP